METLTHEKTVWEEDKSFALTCMIYLGVLLLLIITRGVFESGLVSFLSEEWMQGLFTFCTQVLIMFLVPVLAVKIFHKQSFKKTAVDLGFGRTSGKVIGFAFLLGLLLFVLNIFVASFSQAILALIGFRFPSGGGSAFSGTAGFFISLLLVAVMPGVCEETSHRGLLLKGFSNKLGVGRAVLLSSLIFGLMHLGVRQFFYAAVLGYLIALAVMATRSIWTGVIIHFMNNAIDIFGSYAGDWLPLSGFEGAMNIFSTPIGLFLLFAIVWWVYVMIMKIIHSFARENYNKNEKVLLARFLKSNPQFVRQFVDKNEPLSLDEMSRNIAMYVSSLTKREQVLYYIDTHKGTTRLNAFEKTLLFGVIFLGSVITAMTFVWGVFL